MAVQILSDLHLEASKTYESFKIEPKAPYLALLGDIGNVSSHKKDFFAFLITQLEQFLAVLLVPGNHEAYGSNWPDTLSHLRQFEEDVRENTTLGEFVLLDREAFMLPNTNVTVLGCSLFSFIPPESVAAVSKRLNDFHRIGDWNIGLHNEAHLRDLAWLNAQVSELQKSDGKIIILSHWSPSLDARSIGPRHAESQITSAFSTELLNEPCFKSDQVKTWAFGHTHYNCDFEVQREIGISGLRLVTNQRGYYFAQSKDFDLEKIIEV